MSTKYRVAEHEVIGVPIVEVLPLVIHERIQPPQTGVVLVLPEGRRLNWIPEGGQIPEAGWLLIRDEVLGGITFTRPVKGFSQMFTEVETHE